MVRKILITLATVLGAFTLIAIVLVTWLYVTSDVAFTVPATTADDKMLPSITVNGYRFHGETFGNRENPVAIVLHGGPGGDYRSLLPLASLSDDYFVVFYDQRGSGLSPRREATELTLERFIDDLDGIIDRFSPERPATLVRHSWGAMLATAYIGRYPDRVAAGVDAYPGQVLFLTGSENAIIGEERQRIHMRRFRDARLVVIEGAGHTMIGEKPEESLAVIREFLTNVVARN